MSNFEFLRSTKEYAPFAVDYNTWGKLPFIIKLGNLAVHTGRSVQAADARPLISL